MTHQLSEKEKRYAEALHAEAIAVRTLTQAMRIRTLDVRLIDGDAVYEEKLRLYKEAVEERKAALQALDLPPSSTSSPGVEHIDGDDASDDEDRAEAEHAENEEWRDRIHGDRG